MQNTVLKQEVSSTKITKTSQDYRNLACPISKDLMDTTQANGHLNESLHSTMAVNDMPDESLVEPAEKIDAAQTAPNTAPNTNPEDNPSSPSTNALDIQSNGIRKASLEAGMQEEHHNDADDAEPNKEDVIAASIALGLDPNRLYTHGTAGTNTQLLPTKPITTASEFANAIMAIRAKKNGSDSKERSFFSSDDKLSIKSSKSKRFFPDLNDLADDEVYDQTFNQSRNSNVKPKRDGNDSNRAGEVATPTESVQISVSAHHEQSSDESKHKVLGQHQASKTEAKELSGPADLPQQNTNPSKSSSFLAKKAQGLAISFKNLMSYIRQSAVGKAEDLFFQSSSTQNCNTPLIITSNKFTSGFLPDNKLIKKLCHEPVIDEQLYQETKQDHTTSYEEKARQNFAEVLHDEMVAPKTINERGIFCLRPYSKEVYVPFVSPEMSLKQTLRGIEHLMTPLPKKPHYNLDLESHLEAIKDENASAKSHLQGLISNAFKDDITLLRNTTNRLQKQQAHDAHDLMTSVDRNALEAPIKTRHEDAKASHIDTHQKSLSHDGENTNATNESRHSGCDSQSERLCDSLYDCMDDNLSSRLDDRFADEAYRELVLDNFDGETYCADVSDQHHQVKDEQLTDAQASAATIPEQNEGADAGVNSDANLGVRVIGGSISRSGKAGEAVADNMSSMCSIEAEDCDVQDALKLKRVLARSHAAGEESLGDETIAEDEFDVFANALVNYDNMHENANAGYDAFAKAGVSHEWCCDQVVVGNDDSRIAVNSHDAICKESMVKTHNLGKSSELNPASSVEAMHAKLLRKKQSLFAMIAALKDETKNECQEPKSLASHQNYDEALAALKHWEETAGKMQASRVCQGHKTVNNFIVIPEMKDYFAKLFSNSHYMLKERFFKPNESLLKHLSSLDFERASYDELHQAMVEILSYLQCSYSFKGVLSKLKPYFNVAKADDTLQLVANIAADANAGACADASASAGADSKTVAEAEPDADAYAQLAENTCLVGSLASKENLTKVLREAIVYAVEQMEALENFKHNPADAYKAVKSMPRPDENAAIAKSKVEDFAKKYEDCCQHSLSDDEEVCAVKELEARCNPHKFNNFCHLDVVNLTHTYGAVVQEQQSLYVPRAKDLFKLSTTNHLNCEEMIGYSFLNAYINYLDEKELMHVLLQGSNYNLGHVLSSLVDENIQDLEEETINELLENLGESDEVMRLSYERFLCACGFEEEIDELYCKDFSPRSIQYCFQKMLEKVKNQSPKSGKDMLPLLHSFDLKHLEHAANPFATHSFARHPLYIEVNKHLKKLPIRRMLQEYKGLVKLHYFLNVREANYNHTLEFSDLNSSPNTEYLNLHRFGHTSAQYARPGKTTNQDLSDAIALDSQELTHDATAGLSTVSHDTPLYDTSRKNTSGVNNYRDDSCLVDHGHNDSGLGAMPFNERSGDKQSTDCQIGLGEKVDGRRLWRIEQFNAKERAYAMQQGVNLFNVLKLIFVDHEITFESFISDMRERFYGLITLTKELFLWRCLDKVSALPQQEFLSKLLQSSLHENLSDEHVLKCVYQETNLPLNHVCKVFKSCDHEARRLNKFYKTHTYFHEDLHHVKDETELCQNYHSTLSYLTNLCPEAFNLNHRKPWHNLEFVERNMHYLKQMISSVQGAKVTRTSIAAVPCLPLLKDLDQSKIIVSHLRQRHFNFIKGIKCRFNDTKNLMFHPQFTFVTAPSLNDETTLLGSIVKRSDAPSSSQTRVPTKFEQNAKAIARPVTQTADSSGNKELDAVNTLSTAKAKTRIYAKNLANTAGGDDASQDIFDFDSPEFYALVQNFIDSPQSYYLQLLSHLTQVNEHFGAFDVSADSILDQYLHYAKDETPALVKLSLKYVSLIELISSKIDPQCDKPSVLRALSFLKMPATLKRALSADSLVCHKEHEAMKLSVLNFKKTFANVLNFKKQALSESITQCNYDPLTDYANLRKLTQSPQKLIHSLAHDLDNTALFVFAPTKEVKKSGINQDHLTNLVKQLLTRHHQQTKSSFSSLALKALFAKEDESKVDQLAEGGPLALPSTDLASFKDLFAKLIRTPKAGTEPKDATSCSKELNSQDKPNAEERKLHQEINDLQRFGKFWALPYPDNWAHVSMHESHALNKLTSLIFKLTSEHRTLEQLLQDQLGLKELCKLVCTERTYNNMVLNDDLYHEISTQLAFIMMERPISLIGLMLMNKRQYYKTNLKFCPLDNWSNRHTAKKRGRCTFTFSA